MYSPYSLESHRHESFKGVLLSFDDGDQLSYSLYHPMAFFGDISLKKFLKNFETYVFKGPLKRVFDLALTNNKTPLDIACYEQCTNFLKAEESANEVIKMKPFQADDILKGIKKDTKKKFIFDANAQWTQNDCKRLFDQEWSGAIKYLEDPVKNLDFASKIPIASDFVNYMNYEYKVIKPTAFNHPIKNPLNKPLVVTSYLDHPLGQVISALFAHEKEIVEPCGLMTHGFFKKNRYSELLPVEGNFRFSAYSELISLLEGESWIDL